VKETGPAGQLRRVFGRRVREARVRQGLTQQELARRAGMHPAYVGGVERGQRNVTLEVVERLARALGVAAAELMVEPGAPAAQARFHALAARARDPAHVALALDVAGYLLERLNQWAALGQAAAEPPARYPSPPGPPVVS